MAPSAKIRGFNTPWIGRFNGGDDIVITYNNLNIVVIGESQVATFLDSLPVDNESLYHDMSLVTRWFGGMSLNAAGLTTMQHAVYWDAVVILGLIPGIVFIVPDSEELQHALLLGRGMVIKLHTDWFSPYQNQNWHNLVEADPAHITEVPTLHWITHNF